VGAALHACPGTQSAQNEPVVLFSPRGYRLIPLPSRASAKVLRQYHTLAATEAGMAARDTALRAYAKVLRKYHKEATYLSSR